MKKILIALIFLGLVILPVSVYAAAAGGGGNVVEIITRIGTNLTTIGTAFIIVMIVWAGILFVTATGEPDKVSKAKQALIWAIIGGIVILAASAIKGLIETIAGTGK